MHVLRTLAEFRVARLALTGDVGFVPTMGFLHEGHNSLIERAVQENDHTVASIFINPLQFSPGEDLARYPRSELRDLELLETAGVDLVFMPSLEEMIPPGFQTYVDVTGVSAGLEGEYRPGHFRGVATIVSRLFNIVQPARAYFGQKDAQQVAVIRRLITDLAFSVELVVAPIVRAEDGLALSSRNTYLSLDQRGAATVLYRALRTASAEYKAGQRNPETLRRVMRETLASEPAAQVEYVSVADADTLAELTTPITSSVLLSMAVRFGTTRLIDNVLLT